MDVNFRFQFALYEEETSFFSLAENDLWKLFSASFCSLDFHIGVAKSVTDQCIGLSLESKDRFGLFYEFCKLTVSLVDLEMTISSLLFFFCFTLFIAPISEFQVCYGCMHV